MQPKSCSSSPAMASSAAPLLAVEGNEGRRERLGYSPDAASTRRENKEHRSEEARASMKSTVRDNRGDTKEKREGENT